MQGVVVPNMHFEGCFCSSIVCPYPFVPSMDQLIKHGLHEHTHITPWVSWNYQRQEYVMSLKGDTRREIKGDNKDEPTCVWGSHHSIRIEPICCQRDTYITSLIYFVTMFVIKADPSFTIDGCTILSGLYRLPFLCHVIYFADSSVMYSRWILGRNGRYRRIFMGIVSCLFWPSSESTSRYLEDLHFG